MLRARAWTFAAYLFLTGIAYAQTSPANSDETAIRALVQKYMDARNNRDAGATRSLFTPDADQLVSSGEWRKGIDGVVQGSMASSQREAGKSSITVESVRFLEPNIAIVDGRYEVPSAGDAVRKMWSTLIVKRSNQGWRIAAIRNMLPAPPAAR